MNHLKKLVSTFVALSTMLWSVGGALLFPGIAQAATLSPGDLIKASGPAVYYYSADGKRYVFPNEKTYFSWYSDFGSVKTITDSELAAVLIGGNVTIRPGTKLVKITTDPKTYAVSDRCGTLHWIQTETVAKSLYGDSWAQRVVDVPDAFFVDYEVGSSIATAVHPDGTLVKYAGDSSTYVVMSGQKRKLTGSSVSDNRLNTANAIETTITYSNGADVTGAESALKDVGCATASPNQPAVSGGVSVSLASDTPAGRTVPKNSSSNSLIKLNLTAGSSAARVVGLHLKRVGAGSASDISNVYLYDQNMIRLTSGRTINSSSHAVEFNSLSIDIPANTTVPVYVYADFAATSAGGEHAIQIPDAASVVMEGSGTVSGSLPITGNTFVVGNVSAARVDVTKGVTPSNPTVGSKAVEISNFKLEANTNDVQIRQINLYQAGNISNTDLSNFQLVQGTTVVATAAAVSSKNLITLVFNPPFVIANGISKVFSLKADVGGRSDRTIRTYVEYTTDITAIDQVYNSGAAVCIAATAVGGCTDTSQGSFDGSSTGSNYIEVTTQGGQLTVAFNGPTSANVAKGSLAVPLFDFAMTSESNDLEIRNMDFSFAGTASAAKVKGTNSTEYFRNFKVIDIDTGATVMGPIGLPTCTSVPSTDCGNMQFTDSWTLKSGTTRNLRIVADISNSEDVANELYGSGQNQYKLTFAAWGANDIRTVDTGEFLATTKIVPSAAITGNPMTVKSAGLTVALASDPLGTTVVKKQQDLPAVGISLGAGQQSDVTVTAIKLTGKAQTAMASGYTAAKFDQLVTKIALYDGATKLGDAKTPSSGVVTISNFQLAIPKGTTKTLTAEVTIASTVSSATSTDDFAIGIADTASVTAQDNDANTVTPSVSADLVANSAATGQLVVQKVLNSGTLTLQSDSQPQSTILVGGGSAWKVMARYKATAQYEQGKIDRVAVLHPNDGGVNGDFSMIAIAAAGDTTNRTDVISAGTTSTKDVDLSANPILVPAGSSVNFEIWAKIATPVSTSTATTYSPRTGNTMSLGIATSTQTGEWTSSYLNQLNVRTIGQASGEYLYSTSTNGLVGNVQVLRKGKPVVTKLTPSSLTLTSGAPTDLYKFQVAPDADGGNIAWKQIIFQVTTSSASGSVTLNSFRLLKGSTELSTTAGTEEVYIRRSTDGASITGSTALQTGYVIVRLVNEESVTGSGQVYTLRATPTFTGTGTSISTSFLSSSNVVTGYIVDDPAGADATFQGSLAIDSSVAPDGVANATGTLVWSDNTDIPHSFASGTSGGSRDWTNGTYVSDLTQTQALTQ